MDTLADLFLLLTCLPCFSNEASLAFCNASDLTLPLPSGGRGGTGQVKIAPNFINGRTNSSLETCRASATSTDIRA